MTAARLPRSRPGARRRVARALGVRVDAARHSRDDSGQIIVIIVILVVLLSVLGPLMASQITSDAPLVVLSTNKHAALAAAESGIEWYRNHLDADPNYYLYSASNPSTPADPAMQTGGWCSSACDLGGTSPGEAFHYVPDDSTLFATSGTNAGRVVLSVTGRGGSPGSYVYVTARASFTTSSILANAYFSNTEVLDPLYPDVQQTGVTVTGLSASQGITTYQVTYPVNGASTTTSLWNALCDYKTYQANDFLDWLGQTQNVSVGAETVSSPNSDVYNSYSASNPYYGPFYGAQQFSFTNGNGATVTVPAEACGGTFDFNTGENFAGPVYSNDQLHVCASPTFSGAPISYTSGVSSSTAYAYDWLGSVPVRSGGTTYYSPSGTTVDPVQGFCGQTNTPNFVHGSSLNGNLVLPSWNTQLAAAAASGGCLFTGPTMIALVTSSSGTTMNVWSPLSTGADAPSAACSTGTSPTGTSLTSFGQSFSGSSGPYIIGVPLPANGVVFVQNAGAASTAPTVQDGLNSTGSGCINPYVNLTQVNNPILPTVTKTSATCLEGDTYIEGELSGELTVGSAANIIVTRDLTYACADGTNGPASATDPSSAAACTTGSSPDILGLEAFDNVLVSHPVKSPYSVAQMAGMLGSTSNGLSACSYDGTAATAGTLSGGTSGDPTSGSSIGQPAAVWPSCDISNPIIDAAVISLNGAFGVEYWDQGNGTYSSNGVYLNGADISQYRGPFGLISGYGQTWGYDKQFSFDSRLQFLQPPYALQSAVTSWQDLGYVVCGDANIATQATPACPAVG